MVDSSSSLSQIDMYVSAVRTYAGTSTVRMYVRVVDMLRQAMFGQPDGFTGLAVERFKNKADAGGVERRLGETGAVSRWLCTQPHRE